MAEPTRTTDRQSAPPWHATGVAEALERLAVETGGLGSEEARRRLREHGRNELAPRERPGPLRRFLRQFRNVLIYVLLAAAAFTGLLGEWTDMAVILAVVLINAVIGSVQEGKAERAMDSIRSLLSPRARVLRDGADRELPAAELVPGDIVLLKSGDLVPADLRVVEARGALVEEAALTGESEPVGKADTPVEPDLPLGDRMSMAFAGTMLTFGRLRGVVVATGARTEIGRIGEMVADIPEISTPLLRKIDRFGRRLSLVIVLLSGLVFAAGYLLRGFSAAEMFMAIVALAVAAIPEGLPAAMTITLALGVRRMARHKAIIRRLPAVETLGSVTTICSDKTGTLTRNEMTVARIATAAGTYSVAGEGYRPEGEFSREGRTVDPRHEPGLPELVRAGVLTSEARLRQQDGSWRISGTPTDGALVVLGRKAGIERDEELQRRPGRDEIPFESEQRFAAALHEEPAGGAVVYVKGAPERVLRMCSRQRRGDGDEPLEADAWVRRQEELADQGHRVLAIASARHEGAGALREDRLRDLTLLGLVGIIDPPRPEATEAIAECRRAGIAVKMITGDHLLTARSIAASMGIGERERAVTGRELEGAEGEDLVAMVEGNDVFARASPEHKLRIMEALQSRGEIVAMTGDGVNDAPALKRADVGVAMGIKGSEAAKEASDMVLADDNFATIERAVEEGRTIYDNLVKTIAFILPTNGAEGLAVVAAILLVFPAMPITPVQILWVNMVTAVTLALTLAFEPAEPGIMRRPPRRPQRGMLTPILIWRIGYVSVLLAAAAVLLFRRELASGESPAVAQTITINTLVSGQIFYLFNIRLLGRAALGWRWLLANRAALIAIAVLVVLQLGFTYLEVAHDLFGTGPLSPGDWLLVAGAGLAVFILVEAEKAVARRLTRRGRPAALLTPSPMARGWSTSRPWTTRGKTPPGSGRTSSRR